MNIKNLVKHIVRKSRDRIGYTNCLLNNRELLKRKILEEAYELVCEIGKERKRRFVCEYSDLLYHMIVSMVTMKVDLKDILKELKRRAKMIERKQKNIKEGSCLLCRYHVRRKEKQPYTIR